MLHQTPACLRSEILSQHTNITDIMLGFLTHSSHMKTRSLKSLHWATFHIGASGSVKLASSITASVFPLYSCNWGQDVASWTCACTRPQLQHSILEVISTWSELYGFVLFLFVLGFFCLFWLAFSLLFVLLGAVVWVVGFFVLSFGFDLPILLKTCGIKYLSLLFSFMPDFIVKF